MGTWRGLGDYIGVKGYQFIKGCPRGAKEMEKFNRTEEIFRGDPGARDLHMDFLRMGIFERLETCLLNGKKCAEIQRLLGRKEIDEVYRTPFKND